MASVTLLSDSKFPKLYEIMKLGIIESISVRHVGRLLEEAELKPHQSRYWLTPPVDEDLIYAVVY